MFVCEHPFAGLTFVLFFTVVVISFFMHFKIFKIIILLVAKFASKFFLSATMDDSQMNHKIVLCSKPFLAIRISTSKAFELK